MIMMDKNMDSKQKQQMLNDIDKVEGVKWSLGMNSLIRTYRSGVYDPG